jgi:hypothetical protein
MMRNTLEVVVIKPDGKKPFRNARRSSKNYVPKWISKKWVVRVWTGFIWLSIGPSGGFL